MTGDLVAASKFLSRVLRHRPQAIGLVLDAGGWADIDALIAAAGRHGMVLSRAHIARIVAESDKQRFALDAAGQRIRASQGHSIAVDLGLAAVAPPAVLFHGTTAAALASIRRQGLTRQRRHHVHLSPDAQTARKVGSRRGKPVVLSVRAGDMAGQGAAFYRSANGVWLTDAVPPQFIDFPSDEPGDP
ncbi:MAG: RNA 2'-phosphotransferase [Hyphomicrobiaceae bacterium]|nr:RNA 2'-phosphotransferase [Hyphomicrobiaceae bacterium]